MQSVFDGMPRSVRMAKAEPRRAPLALSRCAPQARLYLPDARHVKVLAEAVCHDCRHRHRIECDPWQFSSAAFQWERKHRGHRHEIITSRRDIPRGFDDRQVMRDGKAPWWLDYKPNADIKLAYAADAAFTITLASLATSSTWVAGREATSVSNGANKYLDYEITGKVTLGTTLSAGELRLYGVKPINDTPTWPDVFDGTDSAETVTNTNILASLPLLWSVANATTNSVAYPMINALTLAQCWGFVPDNFTVFFSHSSNANLDATGGNHEVNYRGMYATSI